MSATRIKFSNYKNYNEFIDGNGEKFIENKETHEIHKVRQVTTECAEGGVVFSLTPEQVREWEKRQERKKKAEQRKETRRINRDMNFYFALSRDRRGLLKPQTIARLFFLATFINYGDNVLRHNDGKPISRTELPKLMKLKASTFKDFWDEVEGKYLFVHKDRSISISNDFYKGSIQYGRAGRYGNSGYQRIFIKSLQDVYRQTPVGKHRYLGYLFLILPWINWEYNVLCWNPQETDREKIEIMTLDEFCRKIGYKSGESQRARFLEAYKQLAFTWKGRREEVCAYLVDKMTGRSYFVVNPFVIYCGSDRSKVEGFGVFFRGYC